MKIYKRESTTAVMSSMKGYNKEIGRLQFRHLPPSNNHEIIGMLSYQTIIAWQCGHDDRGVTIDWFFINRYASTFKNDPQHKKKGVKK